MAGRMPVIDGHEQDLRGEARRGQFALLAEDEASDQLAIPAGKYALLAEDGAEPAARSLPEQLARGVGRTARAMVKGATAIPAMIADAGVSLYNRGAGAIENVTGIPQTRYGSPSTGVDRLMDWVGVPRAENASERIGEDVASAMAGQGALISAGRLLRGWASPAVSRAGETMAAGPGTQTVASAAGAGAAGGTRESGGGEGAQLAAGLGGALTVSAGPATGTELLRRFVRGGEAGRRAMGDRIQAFDDAGTSPSLGQASGSRAIQATESGLAKVPGSAGVMARAAEREAGEMGRRVDDLAQGVAPNASAAKAGARIEKGIGSFVDRFKSEQNFLYEKLDRHIAKDRPVDMTNAANALSALNADIPGAPALSKFFKNSTIQAIEGAMKSDTQDFTARLPYEALKKLRTLVGAEIENTTLTSSVPRSKWKTLYAAISEDLGLAASEAGPDAQRAFDRANRFTRAGHDRIDTFLERVAGKDTVEKIFQAAANPSEIREGASTINAVMRSIPADDRKMVTAAVLRRMGVANPGAQDEAGAVFSAQTFLTNWNKLSPEARLTLFGGTHSPNLLRDLNQVARAASTIREGSRVFANPSGTTQAAANIGGGLAVGLSAFHGDVATAGLLLGGMAGANVTARMLTNPRVVRWFADATQKPVDAIPAALNQLAQSGRDGDAELRGDVDRFVSSAREQLGR